MACLYGIILGIRRKKQSFLHNFYPAPFFQPKENIFCSTHPAYAKATADRRQAQGCYIIEYLNPGIPCRAIYV